MTVTALMLAAAAGAIGVLIGGTEAFIIYGVVLMFEFAMAACGHDTAMYSQYVSNLFFLPAVMFSAVVPACGYAARRYDIQEWETDRSLGFTHDPMVILIGAFTAMLGYIIFWTANTLKLPLDTGAFSVVTVGVLSRMIYCRKVYSTDSLRSLRDGKLWVWNLLTAAVCAGTAAFFVRQTGIVSLGFMFSAVSLILQLFPRTASAPTTHQITMVAGYAVLASGSIIAAIVFGMLAQIIFLLFAAFFNFGCGSHVDPPAVAILICSFMISLIF